MIIYNFTRQKKKKNRNFTRLKNTNVRYKQSMSEVETSSGETKKSISGARIRTDNIHAYEISHNNI